MLDGMKYATQGMKEMARMQDVLTNNLANSTTAGYRREALTVSNFSQVLDRHMGFLPGQAGQVDRSGYMEVGGGLDTSNVLYNSTMTSFSQGPLRETGNQFDLALDDNGVGFFTVKTPDGIRFTRSGSFKLDEGMLKTADGAKLMGMKGPIHIDKGVNFEVTEDGRVKVDGKEIDRLRITTFVDKRVLSKDGDTAFMAPSDKGLTLTKGFTVRQGYIEKGNVNAVQEMVNMLQVSRAYEANQKMLQAQDKVLQTAANQLGKVR